MFIGLKAKENFRIILLNFIPAFLGVLCAFWLSNVNENNKNEAFVNSCIQTIYTDQRNNILSVSYLVKEQTTFQDTLGAYLTDNTITITEILKKANFRAFFVNTTGWQTLKSSEARILLDYELLASFYAEDFIITMIKENEARLINLVSANSTSNQESIKLQILSILELYRDLVQNYLVIELNSNTLIVKNYNLKGVNKNSKRKKTANLALNKPATSSSNESEEYRAIYVNDGDGKTRWSSSFSDAQWIQIDLEKNIVIERIILDWEIASALNYEIQLSNDGTNWKTAYSKENCIGGVEEISIKDTARYVRMFGKSRLTWFGYSLNEFEVYGKIKE